MILGQIMLPISLILAGALAVLARNLSGRFVARWLALSFLVWIAYGVNNILEGAIFTSMSAASLFTVVLYVFASLLCGAAVVWLFPPQTQGADFITQAKTFFSRHTPGSWGWRFLVAILAFPLIYLAFRTADRPHCDAVLRAGLIWPLAAGMGPNPAHCFGAQPALPDRLPAGADFVAGFAAPPVLGAWPDALPAGRRVEHAAGLLDASRVADRPQSGNPGR